MAKRGPKSGTYLRESSDRSYRNYLGTMLRFQKWCERRDVPFTRGVRAALVEKMRRG